MFDGTDGRPLTGEGLTAPWFTSEGDIPAALEDADTRMLTARHRVRYHPGRRLASSCELDPTDPRNFHVQQVVRATDGERTGWGVLEQIAIGPYAPAGFTGPVDVAR